MSSWYTIPGVRPQHDQAAMAGAAHAGEQLIDEPLGAALRVALPLRVADVNDHLAGIQRVAMIG